MAGETNLETRIQVFKRQGELPAILICFSPGKQTFGPRNVHFSVRIQWRYACEPRKLTLRKAVIEAVSLVWEFLGFPRVFFLRGFK